jgi:hypothetical protein
MEMATTIKLDSDQRIRAEGVLEQLVNGGACDEIAYEVIYLRDIEMNLKKSLASFIVRHGFATGHGDSIEELLKELDWQMSDRNARLTNWSNISKLLIEADNSNEYVTKIIKKNGNIIGTMGNLLVEMTPYSIDI